MLPYGFTLMDKLRGWIAPEFNSFRYALPNGVFGLSPSVPKISPAFGCSKSVSIQVSTTYHSGVILQKAIYHGNEWASENRPVFAPRCPPSGSGSYIYEINELLQRKQTNKHFEQEISTSVTKYFSQEYVFQSII